jgi:pilus assembly protein CpaD
MTDKKAYRPSLLLALVLALSGCNSLDGPAPVFYNDVYPITVQPGTVKLEVDATRSVLSADQENAIKAFAGRAVSVKPQVISLSHPDTMEGGATAARISQLLVSSGVSASSIRTQAGADTYAVLAYRSPIAVAQPCGDWSRSAVSGENNLPPPDFGCTSQSNLAAMIANPSDLVVPRAMPPRIAKNTIISGSSEAPSVEIAK